MPRQPRLKLQFPRDHSAPLHRRASSDDPLRRRLRLERLEDRRLLAGVTVNNFNDVVNGNVTSIAALVASNGGDGISLREAITAANADAAADTIGFILFLPGTITLKQGQLGLTSSLTILGPGSGLLTVSGNNSGVRVFDVTDFASTVRNVTISGLTITGGQAPVSNGGGILNRENLTLQNCAITGNSARDSGGGIYNSSTGNLTLQNSSVTGNEVGSNGDGGGIWNGGVATVQNCTIGSNNAVAGGGIWNEGNVTVKNSTISGNSADDGGGIFTNFYLTLDNSTISSNYAVGNGGGIYNSLNGDMSARNSTISSNRADGNGGGIFISPIFSPFATLRNCTITENHSDNDNNGFGQSGGGISAVVDGSNLHNTMIMHDTIVANNYRNSGSVLDDDIHGAPMRGESDDNLIGTGGFGGLNIFSNQINVENPGLGLLEFSGGPTLTHALLAGSPAIDRGDRNAVAGVSIIPLFDQRGAPFNRVVNGDGAGGLRIDIGAFEFVPFPLPAADFNSNGDVEGLDFLAWQRGFGQTVGATRADGNADGDGDVDGDDFGFWKTQFAVAAVAASTQAQAAALSAAHAPSAPSPANIDAAMAQQQLLDAPAPRPRARTRLVRSR